MSNLSENEIRSRLERLAQLEPSPAAAERALERVRQSLVKTAQTPPASKANVWRIIMANRIAKLAAVAAVLIVVAVGLNVIDPFQSGGVVWSQVLEKVLKARSFIHRMQMDVKTSGQDAQHVEFVMYRSADYGVRRDSFIKDELFAVLYIPIDGNAVEVMPSAKQYVEAKFTPDQIAKITDENSPKVFVEEMIKLQYTELGDSVIDGIEVEGVEVDDPRLATHIFEKGIGRLWVDKKTELPVLLEIEGTAGGGTIHIKLVIDQFDWNAELDPADFEPNIPDDYTVMAQVDMSGNEEVLVKGLRWFSEVTGGKYPSNLDIMTASTEMQYVMMADRRRNDVPMDKPPTKEEMDKILAIQPVCLFYSKLLSDGNDVAYYGADVTTEFPHAVLMRYKCCSDQYTVVFADLTIRQVKPDELAKLEATPLNLEPYSVKPQPADGAICSVEQLAWMRGAYAVEHKVYFGTAPGQMAHIATVTEPNLTELPPLEPATTYYWRVDEVTTEGVATAGPVWSFNTGGLVLWMQFEGNDPAVAIDSSGNDLHGRIIGDPVRVPGVFGNAIEMNGDDYVDLGTDPAFDITNQITICAWVQLHSFGGPWQTVIAKGDRTWRLTAATGPTMHFACTGIWPEWLIGTTDVNDGQWHHVAGVYTGRELRLYVDGKLDISTRTSGPIHVTEYPVTIGHKEEKDHPNWNGRLDDIRIYNVALTEQEIIALREEGTAAPTN